jgi:hypothetical protein
VQDAPARSTAVARDEPEEELHVLGRAEPAFDGRDACGFTGLPRRPYDGEVERGTWCAGPGDLFRVRAAGYCAPVYKGGGPRGIRPLVLGYPKNSSIFSTAVKSNTFPTILGPFVFAPRGLDD